MSVLPEKPSAWCAAEGRSESSQSSTRVTPPGQAFDIFLLEKIPDVRLIVNINGLFLQSQGLIRCQASCVGPTDARRAREALSVKWTTIWAWWDLCSLDRCHSLLPMPLLLLPAPDRRQRYTPHPPLSTLLLAAAHFTNFPQDWSLNNLLCHQQSCPHLALTVCGKFCKLNEVCLNAANSSVALR